MIVHVHRLFRSKLSLYVESCSDIFIDLCSLITRILMVIERDAIFDVSTSLSLALFAPQEPLLLSLVSLASLLLSFDLSPHLLVASLALSSALHVQQSQPQHIVVDILTGRQTETQPNNRLNLVQVFSQLRVLPGNSSRTRQREPSRSHCIHSVTSRRQSSRCSLGSS